MHMPKGVYRNGAFAWSDTAVNMLKEYSGRISCAEIAKMINRELGSQLTRNAVLGKQHRMGLCTRTSNVVKVRKPRNMQRENELARDRYKKTMVSTPSLNRHIDRLKDKAAKDTSEFGKTFTQVFTQGRATMVPFAQRGERQCSWPVQGDGPNLMCCGEVTSLGKAYCVAHISLARPHTPTPNFGFGAMKRGGKPSGLRYR
jgi:hypothetical protein